MKSIRKWFCKPKRSDPQLLAQFYFANEELNEVSQELDSFDGRQDPERCTALVNHLRRCQDKVLSCVEKIMLEAIPNDRADRGHRAKFPEDVLLDSLPGQLWFGAECLGAGSTIMNREIESAALRPLARGLTKTLDTMRLILKEQCYENINDYGNKVKDILKKFDETFAEFELSYVSTMVPVKSSRDYDTQQDVIVLFCETLNRALKEKILTQDQVDDYEPGLMFTIPRLAIVSGLVVFPEGPLNMNRDASEVSELFRPFQALLSKIKELLQTLSEEELHLLEKALSSTNGSWEDIEAQLKLMGKGEKTRCHAAVQTDPTDWEPEMDESFNGGLMFGMSPVEEEAEGLGLSSPPDDSIHMLGSSPNGNQDGGIGQVLSTCQCVTTQGVINGVHSFGIATSDNLTKTIPTLSDQPGEDETATLVVAGEQSVMYKISPKSIGLNEQTRRIRDEDISQLYSMSPIETPLHIFAGNSSPLMGVSALDSPTKSCRQDCDRTELGMSPVSLICDHNNEIQKACSQPQSLEIGKQGINPVCKEISGKTHGWSHQDIATRCRENENTTENTALSSDQNSELPKLCSPCDDFREKQTIQDICRQVVDDIVQYTVQYVAFKNSHHDGKCCKGHSTNSTTQEQADGLKTDGLLNVNTPEESTGDKQGNIHDNCAMIKEQNNLCISTSEASKTNPDISNCAVSPSVLGDSLNNDVKFAKCSVSTSNSDIKDSSTYMTHKCSSVKGETDLVNHDRTDATLESPQFGKGKPSTELSRAIPLGECLHNVCGNSPSATSPDVHESRHHLSVQISSPSSGRVYPASAINRVTGSRGLMPEAAAVAPVRDGDRDRRESNVSIAICSSCGDELVDDDELYQWESDDSDSDSTPSMSDNDEHEIAIAIQAAELSAKQEARSYFTSSWDLVHRLFVCIAGVADQLQTNYASDLRNILKVVFEITANPHRPLEEHELQFGNRSEQNTGDDRPGVTESTVRSTTGTEVQSTTGTEVQSTAGTEVQSMAETEGIAQDMSIEEDTSVSEKEDTTTQDNSKMEDTLQDMTSKEDTTQNMSEEDNLLQDRSGKDDKTSDMSEKEDTPQDMSRIEDAGQTSSTNLCNDISDENKLAFAGSLQQDPDTVSQSTVITSKSIDKSSHDQLNTPDTVDVGQDNTTNIDVFNEERRSSPVDNQPIQTEIYDSDLIDNKDNLQKHNENSNLGICVATSDHEKGSYLVNMTHTTQDEHDILPNQQHVATNILPNAMSEQIVAASLAKEESFDNISEDNVFDPIGTYAVIGESTQHKEVKIDDVFLSTEESKKEGKTTQDGKDGTMAVRPKKKRHKSGDSRKVAGLCDEPPIWVPDEECSQCTACKAVFTMIRRKHHCRNCGKIFCSRCSGNSVPLPKFGQEKPVRVCNRCYMFQVTPFQH